MRRWIKRVVWLLVAIAAIAVMVWAFMPEPVVVDLAPLERGAMQVTVNQEGKTRVRDRYIISSPLAGEMQRIDLKAGDAVTAGETVLAIVQPVMPALLDARAVEEAQARVGAAKASLARIAPAIVSAEAQLEHARRQLERRRELVEQRAVSQLDLEQRELDVQVAEAELRAMRAAEDVARFQLEQAQAALLRVSAPATDASAGAAFEIRSPITGQVLRVMQESSGTVAPGTPLLELGDVRHLEAVIDVLSQDAVKIRPGTRAYLDRWGGERPIPATVRRIEPSGFTKISALGVEEQRVNVIVDFVDTGDEQLLGDQYRVDARIVVWEADDVLKAPTGALFREGDQWAVYVADGENAALRRIRIGRMSGLDAQVLEGLSGDEQVILHPSDKIRDGVPVTPRPAALPR